MWRVRAPALLVDILFLTNQTILSRREGDPHESAPFREVVYVEAAPCDFTCGVMAHYDTESVALRATLVPISALISISCQADLFVRHQRNWCFYDVLGGRLCIAGLRSFCVHVPQNRVVQTHSATNCLSRAFSFSSAFNRFASSVFMSAVKDTAGSGFGLAIAKRIAERHGIEIKVDSVPGEGTGFRFVLPA